MAEAVSHIIGLATGTRPFDSIRGLAVVKCSLTFSLLSWSSNIKILNTSLHCSSRLAAGHVQSDVLLG